MAKKREPKEIEQIVYAQGASRGIFMVHSSYWESDALNAVGQVLMDDWSRDETECVSVLNTNDSLSPLWRSPTDALWTASGRGNIYTTAKVKFPPHRLPELVVEYPIPDFRWSVTTLPDMGGKGFRPNVTALWGTTDKNVLAGTFSGGVYRWNGKEWRQEYAEIESCINHIHGSDESNVYAVGHDGTILHFDGKAWHRIPYPSDDAEGRVLTGVRALNAKEALITGRDGRILHGNRNGMDVLADFNSEFYGVALFNKRFFLAAGGDGIQELKGRKVSVLKDNISTVGVFESDKKVFFTEPEQDPASLAEFDPELDPPWWKRSY